MWLLLLICKHEAICSYKALFANIQSMFYNCKKREIHHRASAHVPAMLNSDTTVCLKVRDSEKRTYCLHKLKQYNMA